MQPRGPSLGLNRAILENMYFHLVHILTSNGLVISTLMTSKCVFSFAMFSTKVTRMAVKRGEMTRLHVFFHGTEIVPSSATYVAGVALSLLRAILTCELLKILQRP